MIFSDIESESVARTLSNIGARAQRAVTLETLLTRWERFVGEIERGYALTGYDYADDLNTRDLIREVIDGVMPSAREKLQQTIQPIDDRFRQSTRDLDRPLSLGGTAHDAWWWRRAPNDLSGELALDILTDGS